MENTIYVGMASRPQVEYPLEKEKETLKPEDGKDEKSNDFMDQMGMLYEMRREKNGKNSRMESQMRRDRERREEAIKAQQKRLAKKKLRKLWFEKREEQRENYSEFLKTGKRYATPCPAAEMLAKQAAVVQSLSGFLGM